MAKKILSLDLDVPKSYSSSMKMVSKPTNLLSNGFLFNLGTKEGCTSIIVKMKDRVFSLEDDE